MRFRFLDVIGERAVLLQLGEKGVQFPSIAPLIRGEKRELHSALYGAFLNKQRSVRTRDWKLIRTPGAGEVQLFHVSQDPWETKNLAADRRHVSTLADLDARLRTLMAEMNDPLRPDQIFGAR